MLKMYQNLVEIAIKGETAALCIITDTRGSAPLKAGAKMIVWENGRIFGTIGGGNLEQQVIKDAINVLTSKKPEQFEHNLVQDHQMCCGGSVSIYIEPVMKQNKLIIFGAGHIGKQVANYARELNFSISIVDERAEMLSELEKGAFGIFHLPHYQFLSRVQFDNNTFIIICTHLHEYDREILAYCIKKSSAYLGMIGSKRKILVTRKLFLKEEIATEEELSKIDMPMGYDIGGTSPAEIAISIVARLIAVKNDRYPGSEKIKQSIYAEKDSDSYGCW